MKDDEARPPRTAQRAVDPRGPMRPGGHGDANRRDNTCRGRRTPRWPAFSPWAILIYPATSLLKPFFYLIIVFFSWLHGKIWCDVVSDSVPKKWAWLLRSFLLCKGIWAHFLGLHFGTMQTLFYTARFEKMAHRGSLRQQLQGVISAFYDVKPMFT